MEIVYRAQPQPNPDELACLFALAFDALTEDDAERLGEDGKQSLAEWFSVDGLIHYSHSGSLIEARDEEDLLVGAIFVGKQNLPSWPDGRKAEIFIIAVHPQFRRRGVGRELVSQAERVALRQLSALRMVLHINPAVESDQRFWRSLNYEFVGTLSGWYANGSADFYAKSLQ